MNSSSTPSGRADADSAERVRASPDPIASEMIEDTRSLFGNVGKLIVEKPITVAAVVAAFSFLFGAIR